MNLRKEELIIMKIIFDGYNGMTVPDNKAVEFAQAILDENKDVTIGSKILINAIRLVMIQKGIPYTNIVFIFEGKKILLNENYDLKSWPKNFGDEDQNILRQLRTIRSQLRDLAQAQKMVHKLVNK